MFGQSTTRTAIATAICLQQGTEKSLRQKFIITQNFLYFALTCFIVLYLVRLITLAENVETSVQFLAVNLSLCAFLAYSTRSSAIAEGLREALVTRNPATTKHLI